IMKKTIVTLLLFAAATAANAQTFTANSMTSGDTTVSWNVVGSSGGTGVLTATTNIDQGFRQIYDSSTLPGESPFNGTFVPTTFTNGAGFRVLERSGVVSFSYSGAAIVGDITGALGTLGSGNVLTLTGNPTLTANDIGAFNHTTGTTLTSGTSLGGINIADNNSNGIATFNNWSLGSLSYTGVSPTSSIVTVAAVNFNVIPEPSSALLLGLGCLGMLARRKRS
ncbi:MAG: PEP-CTERM sorting domain-containing protein, partial [Chthoniobacterales bacterium]